MATVIHLNSMLGAIVEVKRLCQCKPSHSDSVQVEVKILLPCVGPYGPESKRTALHPELEFGKRLYIAGESLDCDWGLYEISDYRSRSETFIDETYHAAELRGLKWAQAEVKKLVDAMFVRSQSLVCAGVEA
jgi:hypothetical protein